MASTELEPHAGNEGGLLRRIVRLGRFVVFLASAGWLFPHACTEGMDLTRIQNEHASRQS